MTSSRSTTGSSSPAKKATARAASPTSAPRSLARKASVAEVGEVGDAPGSSTPAYVVKEGEDPWTTAEIDAIRTRIESDMASLRAEVSDAEREVAALMRQSGDGAGDDQADAGSMTLEREQEMSLANNAREMLDQGQHALDRLANGSYGTCESCGQAIGKLRLEAAPRATLCVPCKSKQERR